MTILKCLECPCLQICSVDDTKVDIGWICTWSDLILQPETNEHRTKTGQQNTPHRGGTTNNTKPKQYVINHTYLITRKKKQFGGWF